MTDGAVVWAAVNPAGKSLDRLSVTGRDDVFTRTSFGPAGVVTDSPSSAGARWCRAWDRPGAAAADRGRDKAEFNIWISHVRKGRTSRRICRTGPGPHRTARA